jgi:hypothetical protein
MTADETKTGPDGHRHGAVPDDKGPDGYIGVRVAAGDDDTEGHRGAAQVVADDKGPDGYIGVRVVPGDGGPDDLGAAVVPGDDDTDSVRN